jgi:predicted porin
MNTKLKALAAGILLMTTTQAMATDIELFGKFREFLEVDNISGGKTDTRQGMKLTNFISRIGVRITEPLNEVSPGLKFNAVLDTLFYPDSPMEGLGTAPTTRSTSIGSNEATVGFSNEYFKIDFGRRAHATWKMLSKYGVYSDLFSTPLGEIHNRRALRFNNGIYGSLNLTETITIGYETQLSEKEDVQNLQTASIHYSSGRLNLSMVHFDDGTSKNVSNMFGVAYTFPTDTRVALLVSQDKVTDTTISNTLFPATTTTGTTLSVRQKLNDKWSAEGGYSMRNDDVRAITAGVQYQLNKNLAIQARAQRVTSDEIINFTTADDLRGGVLGTSRTNAGIGIEFTF